MTIVKEILQWATTQPAWQQDALRRLFVSNGTLSDQDVIEVYDLLKQEIGISSSCSATPIPISFKHMPTQARQDTTITLVELSKLDHVNKIPSSRRLKFSESGMTVIYGPNGSGKSGYARVLKKACRARGPDETIHPNAYDSASLSKVPSANFSIKTNGTTSQIYWTNDKNSPDKLSNISVFDTKGARSYLTSEHNVAYLPFGLDIVEILANHLLPKLSKMLGDEIDNIDINKFHFNYLIDESEVGKEIKALSSNSSAATLIALSVLTTEQREHMISLKKVINESNPLDQAERLKASANRLKDYAKKIAKPLIRLGVDAENQLKVLIDNQTSTEKLESSAAQVLQSGDKLLTGTGGQFGKNSLRLHVVLQPRLLRLASSSHLNRQTSLVHYARRSSERKAPIGSVGLMNISKMTSQQLQKPHGKKSLRLKRKLHQLIWIFYLPILFRMN